MSKLRPDTRTCPSCGLSVPRAAKVCKNCKAALDWKRYPGFVESNAKVVAAICGAVIALVGAFAAGWAWLQPVEPAISLTFEGLDTNTGSFLVRNEGKAAGLLRFSLLSLTLQRPEQVPRDRLELWPADEAFLVEPGKDAHIKTAFRERLPDGSSPDVKKSMCTFFRKSLFVAEIKKEFVQGSGRNLDVAVMGQELEIRRHTACQISWNVVGPKKSYLNDTAVACDSIVWFSNCVASAAEHSIELK